MIISPHFWLRLLISFLGLWGFGYAISIARKRNREQGRTSPIVNKTERLKQWAAQAILNAGKVGLGVVLGTLLGMWIRDRQLLDNQHTYFDVIILEKYSQNKYLLQPARMQPWIAKTCSDVDWHVPQQMKFFTYEQMPDCMRVKAFVFYANNKGERVNASLQNDGR